MRYIIFCFLSACLHHKTSLHVSSCLHTFKLSSPIPSSSSSLPPDQLIMRLFSARTEYRGFIRARGDYGTQKASAQPTTSPQILGKRPTPGKRCEIKHTKGRYIYNLIPGTLGDGRDGRSERGGNTNWLALFRCQDRQTPGDAWRFFTG